MSGIARILLARGVRVSGSDRRDTPTLLALRALGAQVAVDHDPANLRDADTVVISTAIRTDNPELAAARARGLRVRPCRGPRRGDGRTAQRRRRRNARQDLDHLDAHRRRPGVRVDPSFAIGGDLNESGSNAHAGEATSSSPRPTRATGPCCSRRSGPSSPTSRPTTWTTTATSPRWRPPSTGSSARCTRTGSSSSAPTTPGPRGCGRCRPRRGARTYGRAPDADLRLDDLDVAPDGTSYTAVIDGRILGRVRIQVPGEHMALNSAAALLSGLELGLPAAELIDGLARFGGVHRRFELKGTVGGVRVYDDYAHHPTEVTAQLTAARAVAGRTSRRRLPAAPLQPDAGVRRGLRPGAGARRRGRGVDVYGAREDPVPGVTGAMVADAVRRRRAGALRAVVVRDRPGARRAGVRATWC